MFRWEASKKSDDAWVQLLWAKHDSFRAICNFQPSGPFADGSGFECPCARGLWGNRSGCRWNDPHDQGPEDRVLYVWFWHPSGKTATSIRQALPEQPQRVGFLDVQVLRRSEWRKLRLGPCSGLHRNWMASGRDRSWTDENGGVIWTISKKPCWATVKPSSG